MQQGRLAVIGASLAACAGATPAGPRTDAGHECRVQLAPRQGQPAPPVTSAVARTAPVSQIVVQLQQKLAPIASLLEARVQKRLADGHFRIGPGGAVTYSAQRGDLSLSVTRSAFVVEAPVRARAEACRGQNCYASCTPEAVVRAELPLRLRADYGFEPARVSLRFTRGCKVRALGGFLTIDVTPMLQNELEPQLAEVARQIDRQLPNLRAEVEKGWLQAAAPHELPLGACFVLQPQGIVQGPVEPSTELLRVRFALLALPELRTRCGDVPPATPLPPLLSDATLPREGVVQVGMVTALSNLARGFEAAPPAALRNESVRVARAEVAARGSDVTSELTLSGGVCGTVALDARLEFEGDGQYIGVAVPRWPPGERERVAESELEPRELANVLSKMPRLAPLLSASALQAAAPTLAAALSRPPLSVSAQVSSSRAAGAAARGDELVAWLEARGSLLVSAPHL
jgi:hypothetical protein